MYHFKPKKPLLTKQLLIVFLCSCIEILCIESAFAQNLNINNNAFVVIQNGAKLVIPNPSNNAITTSGTGGNIISEGEFNQILWKIGDGIGTYTIPFTTKSIIHGGNGTKIPVIIQITNAGTVDGTFLLSTYETDTDFNLPFPSDVTSLNQIDNSDGSLQTVDRFWVIDNSSYTSKPTANLTFTYDDGNNEVVGSNSISESELKAQRWNSQINSWENIQYGDVDFLNNTVSNITVSTTDFWEVWTLQSSLTPLSLTTIDVVTSSDHCQFKMNWDPSVTSTIISFLIEHSVDGANWEKSTQINSTANNEQFEYIDELPENGINYYRLSTISQNGEKEEIKVLTFLNKCSNNEVQIYPNPFSSLLNVYGTELIKLKLYTCLGQEILNQSLRIGENTIDLNQLNAGSYTAHIFFNDGTAKQLKLIKL